FHIRHTGAAVALQGRAKKSQLGHRLDQFPRKAASPIALLNDRDQIVFNKLSRSVANQSLVITEQGIEFEEIHSPELDGHGILFSVSSPRTDAGSRKELSTLANGEERVKPCSGWFKFDPAPHHRTAVQRLRPATSSAIS